jgi:ribosomal protein S27E
MKLLNKRLKSTKPNTPRTINLDWLFCPECGRRNYYFRKKTLDLVCNLCPAIFRADFNAKTTYAIGQKGSMK